MSLLKLFTNVNSTGLEEWHQGIRDYEIRTFRKMAEPKKIMSGFGKLLKARGRITPDDISMIYGVILDEQGEADVI